MRAVVVALVAAMLVPVGTAGARPRDAIVYEDPDDTAGPLDVLSVTRTDARYRGGPYLAHRIEFQERWDDDAIAAEFFLHERDFERSPLCEADTCTGTWVGEIYEDERGNLQGYMWEVSNCDDCIVDYQIPVWDVDGALLIYVPRTLLYPGRHWYTLQVHTEFSNLLGINGRADCRAQTCEDYAADQEETMRFPIGR